MAKTTIKFVLAKTIYTSRQPQVQNCCKLLIAADVTTVEMAVVEFMKEEENSNIFEVEKEEVLLFLIVIVEEMKKE